MSRRLTVRRMLRGLATFVLAAALLETCAYAARAAAQSSAAWERDRGDQRRHSRVDAAQRDEKSARGSAAAETGRGGAVVRFAGLALLPPVRRSTDAGQEHLHEIRRRFSSAR